MKQKLLVFYKKVLKHELISGSIYIFAGTLIASFANFLFNLFLARNVSNTDFGIYAALASFVALLSIPSQAISPIIIRFATEYISHKKLDKAKSFFQQTIVLFIQVGILIIIAILLTSKGINNFFHLGDTLYIFLAGILIVTVYIGVVITSYLQSLLKFKFLSLVTLLNSTTKLILGVILVLLGMRILGVIITLIVATLVTIFIGIIPLIKLFAHVKKASVGEQMRKIGTYSLYATIAMLGLTSFVSSDILLVKHFFHPEEAGLYAKLALVGKIIFYFISPLIVVLFPLLLNKFHKGQRTKELLLFSVALISIPSIVLAMIYGVFPSFFLHFFMNQHETLHMSPYLGLYGLYIALYNVINTLTLYFLSNQNNKSSYIVATGAICQIIGIALLHSSFYEIIYLSLVIVAIVCALQIYILIHHFKLNK